MVERGVGLIFKWLK